LKGEINMAFFDILQSGGTNNIDGAVYYGTYGVASYQFYFDTKTGTYGKDAGQVHTLTHVKVIGTSGSVLERMQAITAGKYIYNDGYTIKYGTLSAGTIINAAGSGSGQELFNVLIYVGE
jgi:hypothetical protein